MAESNTLKLSVDEALSRADSALRKGDLNLASSLLSAVSAHDNCNPVKSFSRDKIEFLLNELKRKKNSNACALLDQSVSTPEGANAAIEALDRALQSVSSERVGNTYFKSENIEKGDSPLNGSHFSMPEEPYFSNQGQGESHIRNFDQEGFCVIRNAIKPNQINLLKGCAANAIKKADAIFEYSGNDQVGMHIKDQFYVFFNPSNHFSQLKDVNFCSEVMSWIRKLLGPNSYLIHDQFTIKNPANPDNQSGGFGWHQDRYNSESVIETHDPFISCLIPLHDMNDDNGGLRIVPYGNYNNSRKPMLHTNGNITEDVEKYSVTIDCMVGDIIFWSSNTLHSSMPNTSSVNSRWAYIAQFSGSALSMADRNDSAMRGGHIIGQSRPDPSRPLLHGVANPPR